MMLSKWKQFIERHQLFNKGQKIVLAVSGGMDSMLLWHLMEQINQPFVIAHCNFQLRGNESDNDAAFIQKRANDSNVEFFSKSFDTEKYATENGLSIQMAARELRYEWFESLRNDTSCDMIATAHHADDNAETILLNLSKGTGIAGTCGIRPKVNILIRPLLCFTREEIDAYVKQNNIAFREDSSNASIKYERNYIRHEVISKFKSQYPDFIEKMDAFAFKMQESEAIYRVGLKSILKKLVEHRMNAQFVPILKLQQFPFWRTLLFEWLAPFGFRESQMNELISIINSDSGKAINSSMYRLLKDRKFLILAEQDNRESGLKLIEANTKSLALVNMKFTFQKVPVKELNIKDSEKYAYLDFDKLSFPLVLRPWKRGDYFYPLGMKKKKKKVSDFFQDKKLNTLEKEGILLLFSGEQLVWVCGHRIDERFKVRESTQSVLKISITEK